MVMDKLKHSPSLQMVVLAEVMRLEGQVLT